MAAGGRPPAQPGKMAAPAKRKREGPQGGGDTVSVFRKAVQDLKSKSQSKIGSVTALAEHCGAAEVCQILADEITAAPAGRIQPLISVVDSILKKVGKEYKHHLSARMPGVLRAAHQHSDATVHEWMQKMVNLSWRKHELLPVPILDLLDEVFTPGKAKAAQGKKLQDDADLMGWRLNILTKIIERRNPTQEELQEIMKVPEIRKAIAMQQKGERQKAMAVLSKYKQELERLHREKSAASEQFQAGQAAGVRPSDPRQLDPRQAEAKPADPRQQAAVDPRSLDPRMAAAKPVDPRQSAAAAAAAPSVQVSGKRAAEVTVDPRQKQARIGEANGAGLSQPADAEQEPSAEERREILRGLPSIGFSEAWLRQFMEQMPNKAPGQDVEKLEAPCVGRKVLGASGEQMVYVDELDPNEMLLLLQLIFLLEERLRRSGGGSDITQRIPHTFSYLQADPLIEAMLKRFYDELPHQCNTSGFRFASRDKLRKHQDLLVKRRSALTRRVHGAEARGWMESIPEWVGNRDLVVGPALFRLGGAGEEGGPGGGPSASSEAYRSLTGGAAAADAKKEEGSLALRICPLDERRAVCPISGERFERIFSAALNDWAYVDAVAVEPDSMEPISFQLDGQMEARALSETAVLFKASCFFNTPPARRKQALAEYGASIQCPVLSGAGADGVGGAEPAKKSVEDPELAALAKARPAARKCF